MDFLCSDLVKTVYFSLNRNSLELYFTSDEY